MNEREEGMNEREEGTNERETETRGTTGNDSLEELNDPKLIAFYIAPTLPRQPCNLCDESG